MDRANKNDQQQQVAVGIKYQNNFARHILGINLHLQSAIMQSLTQYHGHTQLRISFEAYLSLASQGGIRLSDIARTLGISRQAASQNANKIVAAGYLRRIDDPVDKRAKPLVTTSRAKELIAQGVEEANKQQKILEGIAGKRRVQNCTNTVAKLTEALGLLTTYAPVNQKNQLLAAVLPRLTDYINDRLQTLTMDKGHPSLKRSFGSVLTSIGPGGGRIQTMAAAHDVSKQAISVIATELEQLGYIERSSPPNDPRQLLLFFTNAGQKLIADSVTSVDELEAEFSGLIGPARMNNLKFTLVKIYRSLQLEEEVFERNNTQSLNRDVHVLAKEIKQQLTKSQVNDLVRLLSATTSSAKTN